MQRPLLLEGEPGTGKTALAEALAEALDAAADPAAVLRGHRRHPGALRLGLPAADPAPAGARGGRRRPATRRRGGREEPVRRAVPARPAGAAGAAAEPGGAAGRRGRPGRRRVRGVPARGAVDLPGDDPRARHRRGPRTPPIVVLTSNRTRELHDALKRRCLYHWIDHPGLEREVAIVRSRAPEVSRRAGRARSSRVVQQLRDRDDLLKPPGVAETLDWARALHHLGTDELDLATAARDARRAGEVPRGRRPGAAGPRPDAGRVTMTACATRPTRSCSGSPARCAPPACRSPRTARTASSRRSALVGLDDQRGDVPAPAGPRCAPGPTTWSATTRSSRPLQRPRRAAARRGRRRPRRRRAPACPTSPSDGGGDGDEADDVVRAMASATEVLRHRDVADADRRPRRHRLAAMFATLRPAAAASRRTARHQRVAPRRRRRLAHAARQPAPDGRAGRDRLAAPRHAGRAGWCCWSTCPAR